MVEKDWQTKTMVPVSRKSGNEKRAADVVDTTVLGSIPGEASISETWDFTPERKRAVVDELDSYLIFAPILEIIDHWDLNDPKPVDRDVLLQVAADAYASAHTDDERDRAVALKQRIDNEAERLAVIPSEMFKAASQEFLNRGGGETLKEVFSPLSSNSFTRVLPVLEGAFEPGKLAYTGPMYRLAEQIMGKFGKQLLALARISTTFYIDKTKDLKLFLQQRAKGDMDSIQRPNAMQQFTRAFISNLTIEPSDPSQYNSAYEELTFNIFKLSALISWKKILGVEKTKELPDEARVNKLEVAAKFVLIELTKLLYEQAPVHWKIVPGGSIPNNQDLTKKLFEYGYQQSDEPIARGNYQIKANNTIRTLIIWPGHLEHPVRLVYEVTRREDDPGRVMSIGAFDEKTGKEIFGKENGNNAVQLQTGPNGQIWDELSKIITEREFTLYFANYDPNQPNAIENVQERAKMLILEFNRLMSKDIHPQLKDALMYKYLDPRRFKIWKNMHSIEAVAKIIMSTNGLQGNPFLEIKSSYFHSDSEKYANLTPIEQDFVT